MHDKVHYLKVEETKLQISIFVIDSINQNKMTFFYLLIGSNYFLLSLSVGSPGRS